MKSRSDPLQFEFPFRYLDQGSSGKARSLAHPLTPNVLLPDPIRRKELPNDSKPGSPDLSPNVFLPGPIVPTAAPRSAGGQVRNLREQRGSEGVC